MISKAWPWRMAVIGNMLMDVRVIYITEQGPRPSSMWPARLQDHCPLVIHFLDVGLHVPLVSLAHYYACRPSSGWHIRLFPRFCWHQTPKQGLLLIYVPYTEKQILFTYQQPLGNNRVGHPVDSRQNAFPRFENDKGRPIFSVFLTMFRENGPLCYFIYDSLGSGYHRCLITR